MGPYSSSHKFQFGNWLNKKYPVLIKPKYITDSYMKFDHPETPNEYEEMLAFKAKKNWRRIWYNMDKLVNKLWAIKIIIWESCYQYLWFLL